ncbi:MAG: hypothetical protein Q4D98_04420 [Planctomycetia bacterium]|nr:hypothetical protein [Planctomycetia bacterium]
MENVESFVLKIEFHAEWVEEHLWGNFSPLFYVGNLSGTTQTYWNYKQDGYVATGAVKQFLDNLDGRIIQRLVQYVFDHGPDGTPEQFNILSVAAFPESEFSSQERANIKYLDDEPELKTRLENIRAVAMGEPVSPIVPKDGSAYAPPVASLHSPPKNEAVVALEQIRDEVMGIRQDLKGGEVSLPVQNVPAWGEAEAVEREIRWRSWPRRNSEDVWERRKDQMAVGFMWEALARWEKKNLPLEGNSLIVDNGDIVACTPDAIRVTMKKSKNPK